MPGRFTVMFALFSVISFLAGPAFAQQSLPSLAGMLEKVLPSVVTIRVIGERYNPVTAQLTEGQSIGDIAAKARKEPFASGGSGVIIDAAQGLIITNRHVVADAMHILVDLYDGRSFSGTLVGSDAGSDIAMIRIPGGNIPQADIGNSDALRVGDVVVAVGNPFGLEGTATMGIVSSLMRSDIGYGLFECFVQTDAAINPGNSGGALVDMNGRLVAINTVTGARQGGAATGIGFSVPINMARSIGDQIVKHGRPLYGGLGLHMQPVPADVRRNLALAPRRSVSVVRVEPGSPAERAGLRAGDVVESVDGRAVRSPADYVTSIATREAGTEFELSVVRPSGRSTIKVRSAALNIALDPMPIGAATRGLGGASVVPITLGSAHFGRHLGIEIKAVSDMTSAARLGLQPGDVLIRIDETRLRTSEDLNRALERSDGSPRRLGIIRNDLELEIEYR